MKNLLTIFAIASSLSLQAQYTDTIRINAQMEVGADIRKIDTVTSLYVLYISDTTIINSQINLIGAYVKWCENHPIVISTRPSKGYVGDYKPMTKKRMPDIIGYYEWLCWLRDGLLVDVKIENISQK